MIGLFAVSCDLNIVEIRRFRAERIVKSLYHVATMVANAGQERHRLAELYAKMSEGELRKLAKDAGELTDIARDVLASEIGRRGLDIQLNDLIPEVELEFREMVTIQHFRDLPEALLAKGKLDSAGIECVLVDQNMVRMDWFISNLLGGIKVEVRKDDREEALAVLTEPISEAFEVEGIGNYEQPHCPHCGSFDITHEAGLDKRFALAGLAVGGIPIPVRRDNWKCQSCGHKWQNQWDEPAQGPAP